MSPVNSSLRVIVHNPAGRNREKMNGRGQQTHSGRSFSLNDARGAQSVPRKYPPHVTPPGEGAVLILPSEYYSRDQDSSDQTTFSGLLVSICSLGFLFLTGHSCMRLALLHSFVVTHVFFYLFDGVWAFSSDLWHELNSYFLSVMFVVQSPPPVT